MIFNRGWASAYALLVKTEAAPSLSDDGCPVSGFSSIFQINDEKKEEGTGRRRET